MKRLLVLMLVGWMTVGYAFPNRKARMLEMTNPALSQLSLLFVEHVNNQDDASLADLIADNFKCYKGEWIEGREAALALVLAHVHEGNYEVLNTFQDGSTTVLEYKIEKEGKTCYGVDLITWQRGKMIELRSY